MPIYALFNPKANEGRGEANARKLEKLLDAPIKYMDILDLDMPSFFRSVSAGDRVYICGGDGTLNNFVNRCSPAECCRSCGLFYFPTGSGNDFMNDLRKANVPGKAVKMDDYVSDLPVVSLNGSDRYFLNGVGTGIDGYCCAEVNRQRSAGRRRISYTKIALQGLMRHYRPVNARVTVDGQPHDFQNVWMVSSMKGQFFGSGMCIAPIQDRKNRQHTLTVVVLHDVGKWYVMRKFPSVFKGRHIKYKKMVQILTGHEIAVEFDRPAYMQVDGETVEQVRNYKVISRK